MERAWYKVARNCLSLRKNTLRVDMAIYVDPEETDFPLKVVLYFT